jgi:hypothetical protein
VTQWLGESCIILQAILSSYIHWINIECLKYTVNYCQNQKCRRKHTLYIDKITVLKTWAEQQKAVKKSKYKWDDGWVEVAEYRIPLRFWQGQSHFLVYVAWVGLTETVRLCSLCKFPVLSFVPREGRSSLLLHVSDDRGTFPVFTFWLLL